MFSARRRLPRPGCALPASIRCSRRDDPAAGRVVRRARVRSTPRTWRRERGRLERTRHVPGRLVPQARDRGHRARTHRAAPRSEDRRSTRLLRQMLTYSDNAAANAHGALLRWLDVRWLGARERHDAVDRPRRHGDVRRLHARRGRRRHALARSGDPAQGRQPAVLGSWQEDECVRPRQPHARRVARQRRARAAPCRSARLHARPTRDISSTSSPTCATPASSIARSGRLAGVRVLHKAGWINDARHDNGIVLWSGGALVVTVMTYRAGRCGPRRRTCSRPSRRGGIAPFPRLNSRIRGS